MSTNPNPELFATVCKHAQHGALLGSIADVLEWDEQTGMPAQAGDYRATQVSTLRAMKHRHLTCPRFGEQLQQLSDALGSELDSHEDIPTTVRCLQMDYQRHCKLPVDLVEAISQATTKGQQTWVSARRNNSFAEFLPALQQIVRLKQTAADHLASGGDRYEALIDEYEPGVQISELATLFDELRAPLVQLVEQCQERSVQARVDLLERCYPIEAQRQLSHYVAQKLGFDFERGRLDDTAHPFCTTLGPDDCRILSRYHERWFPSGLFGTIHETGHGLYEQGLRRDWFGLPPGSCTSLGIHESQSRLWENQVGRSSAFWEWLYPECQQRFPGALTGVPLASFHRAINAVRPSLIRVEADEVTYNLHILIRFQLERALMAGDLQPQDLAGAWDDSYQSLLGIRPSAAADGVLQDVHWSAGLIGYFPTYTLGNLAAAQLFEAAQKQLPDLLADLRHGRFDGLCRWLRERIHQHGRSYRGSELVEMASGKHLTAEPLLRSLRTRYFDEFES